MGALISKNRFVPNDKFPGQQPSTLVVATKLGFSRREVNKLFRAFRKMDSEGHGLIFFPNFLEACEVEAPWMARMLASHAGKVHRNSSLNFQEFLTVLWDICSADTSILATWIFHFFNKGKRGDKVMSGQDTNCMIDTVWGRRQESTLHRSMSNMHLTDLTLENFLQITQDFPSMLFRVFQRQAHIRGITLSVGRWNQLAIRRQQLFGDQTVRQIVADCSAIEKDVLGSTFRSVSGRTSRYFCEPSTGHSNSFGSSANVSFQADDEADEAVEKELQSRMKGSLLVTPPSPEKVSSPAANRHNHHNNHNNNNYNHPHEGSLETEKTPRTQRLYPQSHLLPMSPSAYSHDFPSDMSSLGGGHVPIRNGRRYDDFEDFRRDPKNAFILPTKANLMGILMEEDLHRQAVDGPSPQPVLQDFDDLPTNRHNVVEIMAESPVRFQPPNGYPQRPRRATFDMSGFNLSAPPPIVHPPPPTNSTDTTTASISSASPCRARRYSLGDISQMAGTSLDEPRPEFTTRVRSPLLDDTPDHSSRVKPKPKVRGRGEMRPNSPASVTCV